MTLTLARTKLNRPRLSRDIVQRPALVQRLNDGLDRSLTLVVAPAGFGKTMLVAEWVSQAPQRVAWLSLDEGDNDVATPGRLSDCRDSAVVSRGVPRYRGADPRGARAAVPRRWFRF